MAVTRIKNNQITDNTIEYQKIKDGTLVGTKFNANITLNSNVSIIGNLQVTGETTTISSINTFINDPLVIFNNGYVGSPSYDVGMLVNRNLAALGDYGSLNTAWVWSESDKAFIAALTTETGSTTGQINRTYYGNIKVGNVQTSGANIASLIAGDFTATGVLRSTGNLVAQSGTTSPTGAYNQGALIVTGDGGLGVGGNLNVRGLTDFIGNVTAGNIYVSGNINATVGAISTQFGVFYGDENGHRALYAGVTDHTQLPTVIVQVTGNVDSYSQLNLQNVNNGAYASGDIVVTADDGTDTTKYIDLGIANSNYNYPGYEIIKPHDGFLDVANGNLVLFLFDPGYNMYFYTGGTTTTNEVGFSPTFPQMTLEDGFGTIIEPTTESVSRTTGALRVRGGVGILGNLHAAAINNTPIGNTTPNTGYFTNITANTITANNFSSSNVNITGGNITNVSGLTVSNISVTTFNAANISTGNAQITGGNITGLSNLTVNGNTTITGNLVVANTTNSTSATTGAVVIQGGVGVGGNLYVNGNTVISGNLTILGNVTNINTTEVYVSDLNITIANGAPSAFAANGSGISVDGAFANITYFNVTDSWNFNKEVIAPILNVTSNVYLSPTSGTVVINPTNTGYMENIIIGGNTAANVTSTNLVATSSLIVNATNSIQLTGGTGPNTINNIAIGLTTPVTANFTFANVSALTVTSNASFANVAAATTFSANLSSPNVQITGGNVTGVTNVYGTTGQFTNFSSGNVIITGGSLNSTSIGLTTPAAANITVLNVSQDTKLTTANATSVQITNLGDVTPGTAVFTTLNTTSTTKIGGNLVLSSGATNPLGSSTEGALVIPGQGGAAIGGNVFVGNAMIINGNSSSFDTFIRGAVDDSLFAAFADIAYDQVVIGGNITQANVTLGAKLQIDSKDSLLLPKGFNADRPSGIGYPDVAGMIRFSLTSNSVEYYDGANWISPSISFTVISSTQFSAPSGDPNGNVDGVNAAFKLPSSATTNGVIVTINGVVQLPTTAYSITGAGNDTVTFTEAPALGDVIDVRILTTTTAVTSVDSATGYFGLRATNSNVKIVTGPGAANDTVQWVSGGAEVNLRANVTVASSGSAAVIDSFAVSEYGSSEYTVTATIQGTNIRQMSKVTLVTNGSATTILQFGDVCTAGNSLVTFSGGFSAGSAQLKATTTNNNTIFRIAKLYQPL
jgi:hypothetical protein